MMNTQRWLVTIFCSLLVVFVLAGYKYQQITAAIAFGASFPEPSASVEAISVKSSWTESYVTTIGLVIAPHAIELRNELEGRISRVNFKPGDSVKKGAVLLQFDISTESARLNAAVAREKLAQLEWRRATQLFLDKTVSQQRVDQSQAEYQIALANVQELQAVIDKKTLRSPFDAVAGLHQLDQGEFLQSNTHIVNLVGVSDYQWVDFNLPLAEATIDVGGTIKILLPNQPGTMVDASIIAKNPQVSLTSRNLQFRAQLIGNYALPPNAIVNINVPLARKQQIQIPVPAMLRDGLGMYVYILQPEPGLDAYRARRQEVVPGDEDQQRVVIATGLADGDLIAGNGAFKLRDNLLTYIRSTSNIRSPSSISPAPSQDPVKQPLEH